MNHRGLTITFILLASAPAMSRTTRPLTAALAASPTAVTSGGTSLVTWSSTNAASCSLSDGVQKSDVATSGSVRTPPLTKTTTVQLTCVRG